MKRRRSRSVAILTVIALLLGGLAPARTARADLAGDVRKALNHKAVKRDKVGVAIVYLGSGAPGATGDEERSTVYQHNANTPFIPASNLKLITTAAALELLGRDFRFRTTFAVRASAADGAVAAAEDAGDVSPPAFDVAIIGDGDPTLGDAEMLRKVGWDVDTVFRSWADVLEKRNVTTIRDLYVDDSIFDEIFVHPNWPAEQQHKRYVAQVGGVNLNANCVDFFLTTGAFGDLVTYATDPDTRYIDVTNACVTGDRNAVWLARDLGRNTVVLRGETDASNSVPISVTIHDPPMYAATVLAETLRAAGIRMEGQVLRSRSIREQMSEASVPASGRWVPVAIHETPISTVLARSNKDSMNLYADALCKRIGHATSGTSGSWTNGTAAVAAYLQSIGVDEAEFAIDDGCGLSRENQISALAITQVLSHVFHSDDRQAFVDSLSLAGFDGTLDKRFRSSDLRGRVFGKSGYIAGVSTLSGYVRTRDDQWYAFSILINNVVDIPSAKLIQERIVRAIDEQQMK